MAVPPDGSVGQKPFISRFAAGTRQRRLAAWVVAVSCVAFAVLAPFAKQPLPPVAAFLPIYQSALVVCELMTAVLIFGQFVILGSRALLVLASAYLFSALMAVAHALSFPGLFAPAGLLGSGAQITAWIYFLWHGGFPLLVMGYGVLADRERGAMATRGRPSMAIVGATMASVLLVCGLVLIASTGQDLLPPIMQGDRDAPAKVYVATATWLLPLAAVALLWRRRPLTILDLWLIVVMCVWVFDIALAAVLNAGRYDVGWYAGRIYGLLAGTFVLVVLLLENAHLHAELARTRERERALAEAQHQRAQLEHEQLEERVRERTSQLHESEQRLRLLIGSLKDHEILMLDPDGRVMTWNEGTLRLRGYSESEVLGQPVELFYTQEDLAQGKPARLRKLAAIEGRAEDEGWRLRKDGSRFYASASLAALRDQAGKLIGFAKLTRDITELVRARERLQAQTQRAESLLEAAPDAMVIVDRQGRIVMVNAQTETVFGYSREELLGQAVEMLVPEQLRSGLATRALDLMQSQTTRTVGERGSFARRKDGRRIAVDVSLRPFETPEGTLVISTIRDVTERHEAEQRIRSQLEHLSLLDQITRATGERQDLRSILQVMLRSLEDSLPVDFGCVCLLDAGTNTLRMACTQSTGLHPAPEAQLAEGEVVAVDEDGLGRCLQGQLIYEAELDDAVPDFQQRLARSGLGAAVMAPLRSESQVFGALVVARRAADSFTSVECEFLRQLSEHVALSAHQAQLYESLQRAYDELRQTQQAVMQHERLRALGQMASGVAHDINNALSPVSLYAESMLETEKNLSERARGQLEVIVRAVDDVAHTVARMREFYRDRKEPLALSPVDLNALVPQVIELTRARWSDMEQHRGVMVHVRCDRASNLPTIVGVESEIREALTNLVLNAVDAMPEGGTITVRTRRIGLDGRQPESAVVEVVDSGVGMDDETRRRCLEPFFTTKGERGTGLGLAMVFGIAERHSADLEIDSVPGAGTTVRLVFAAQAGQSPEPDSLAQAAPASRLRLLVVDDDPVLIRSLRDALESDGHEVVVANGGQAGIDAFRASLSQAHAYAVVFTDLGMPYVDGRKVAAAVKEASPATPVIMLTGWGQRMLTDADLPDHVDRVLPKPPRLRAVREALAQLTGRTRG